MRETFPAFVGARWVVVSLALFLLFTAARGASETRPAARLDHKIQPRIGGAIGIEAQAIGEFDRSDRLRSAWEAFDARHGGGFKIHVDERTGMPALVSGRGIAWFSPDEVADIDRASLEARARSFLSRNEPLFGDWTSDLELDTGASLELRPGHWQLVFRQVVDGLRVENARLDFHIKHGRVVMFGAALLGAPRTRGLPSIDAGEAREALDDYLEVSSSGFEEVESPTLAMIAVDPGGATGQRTSWAGIRGEGLGHALIWRFRFRAPQEAALWVGEVDAHEGTVLAFYDDAHYAAIRGGVFPVSNDGDCPEGGCEIASFPMPFADYVESGQPESFGDAFGNMQCVDTIAPVETHLAGEYVQIVDACGAAHESGTCDGGVELGRKTGEDCDVAPGASPGNSAAARTAFYHINRVAQTARFYDPANPWLRDQLTVNVNVSGTCNAFWQNGTVNMFASGDGCANTGELSGVLVHEWGHGYDENDGGGFDNTSEAYADVVAIFANRDSCVSRGWFNDGRMCTGYGDTCLDCTGIRDHDWAARERNTPTTPTNFTAFCPSGGGGPCSREAHCESYPISESIYDLATRDLPAAGLDPDSSWQLAERLWYETRPGSGGDIFDCFRLHLTHSCFAISWFQRMLALDDDDGNLSNGTPHAAALFAAFDRHDISCGRADDAENQSHSGCPVLTAPVLTVAEGSSGTDLGWGAVANAAEYRVYRGEVGCNRQQVPVATLPGTATSFLDVVADPDLPRHYRVEAFGTNHACHSPVSNCESTPLGARLQQNGYSLVEDGSGGNGDGIPERGETVFVPVTLLNAGVQPARDVSGTLRLVEESLGDVIVPQATWPDLDPATSGQSDAPHFAVTISESVPCGAPLVFELDSTAVNDRTRTSSFAVVLSGDAAPTEAPTALTVDTMIRGVEVDLVLSWNGVDGAAGYHVLQSTAASFDTAVELSGSTEGPTSLTLPNGAYTTPGLTFFQVRAVSSCGLEGP